MGVRCVECTELEAAEAVEGDADGETDRGNSDASDSSRLADKPDHAERPCSSESSANETL